MDNNKKNVLKMVSLVLVIIIVVSGLLYWQNNDIVISRYMYSNKKTSSKLNGYKIVQISDLHNKSFGKNNSKLINKVRAEKPDIIVITGDIIDSSRSEKKVALSLVKELSDIARVYYVNGNHEKSIGIENYYELENELKDSGANIINNSAVKVQDDFWLVGVDDTSLNADCEGTINEIIIDNKIPKDAFKVLLAHEPQLFDKFTQFDMVLCGHAHGGQFRIPFTNIGFVAPDQGFFPKYTAGKHVKNDTTMYISRGLGNSIIPFRIFNRPELVKITLDANS